MKVRPCRVRKAKLSVIPGVQVRAEIQVPVTVSYLPKEQKLHFHVWQRPDLDRTLCLTGLTEAFFSGALSDIDLVDADLGHGQSSLAFIRVSRPVVAGGVS